MVKSILFTCQKETEPKTTPQPDSVEGLVAFRLRQIRKKQGLSLRALAERSGLNVNTLSLIENGKSSPSVGTLQQLAVALGISASVFLEADKAENKLVYVQADCRPQMKVGKNLLENLGVGLERNAVQPFVMHLSPGEGSGKQRTVHTGQEFIYCLSGMVRCWVEEQSFILNSGDSLLFEAHLPHRWVNEGQDFTQILLVLCPADAHEALGGRHFDELIEP